VAASPRSPQIIPPAGRPLLSHPTFAFARTLLYNFNDIPEFTPHGVTATGPWTGTVPCATSADVTLERVNKCPTEQCSALRVSQGATPCPQRFSSSFHAVSNFACAGCATY